MSVYYVLHINDVSDPHNHRYSVVYPSSWYAGEGLVFDHANHHGYLLELTACFEDYEKWVMRKPDGEQVLAWADLERVFL